MSGRRVAGMMVVALSMVLSACTALAPGKGAQRPDNEEMSFDQMAQTDFNRTVTIAMRNCRSRCDGARP